MDFNLYGRRWGASAWAQMLCRLTALLVLTGGLVPGLGAPSETNAPSAELSSSFSAPVEVPDDPLGRGTPRSSVENFLGLARAGDFVKAAEYLDLASLPENDRASQGPKLARQLWFLLERRTRIVFSALSIHPLGDRDDGLPPNRERLARIQCNRSFVDITLERLRDPSGLEVWKVSSTTVEQIPLLYGKFRLTLTERFFSERTVNWLLRTHPLGLSLLTWMGLLWAVCVWALLIFLGLKIARRAVGRVHPGTAAHLLGAVYAPAVIVIITGLMRSMVPRDAIPQEIDVLFRGRTILIAVTVWIFFRLADFGAERARARLLEREERTGFHLIDLVRRIVKVALVVLGLIVWLDNLGFKVSTIVASLGIIGLAVGLASQKFIEDLIAAMTLHATGVVKRDEAIRFGDKSGVVEDIGLRMIKIRTVDRTLITMPNASFAAMPIENFGRRDKFLFQPRLGLRYETTPDQLRFLLRELRRQLQAHAKVIKRDARVRFVGFGACSLDVELSCYINETSTAEYLAVVEDLNLRIMDAVARAGTGFALSSRTIYLEQGQRIDKALSRQAEAQAGCGREEGQVFAPKDSAVSSSHPAGTVRHADSAAVKERPDSS